MEELLMINYRLDPAGFKAQKFLGKKNPLQFGEDFFFKYYAPNCTRLNEVTVRPFSTSFKN